MSIKKPGNCARHGAFWSMTPTGQPAKCPKCVNQKYDNQAQEDRRKNLEGIIQALRENPDLAEEFRSILGK